MAAKISTRRDEADVCMCWWTVIWVLLIAYRWLQGMHTSDLWHQAPQPRIPISKLKSSVAQCEWPTWSLESVFWPFTIGQCGMLRLSALHWAIILAPCSRPELQFEP